MTTDCSVKLKFATKSGALAAARNYEGRYNKPTGVYHCDRHLCWHLTTKRVNAPKP